MLVYSDFIYIPDNGNGYDLYERDAICTNCGKVIDRQKRYRGWKEFGFSENKMEEWKHCPYCGEKFIK